MAIIVDERLRQFVEGSCDGRCCLDVLVFLGRHPHVRFSQLTIAHALDTRVTDIIKALRYLRAKGLVVAWDTNNILPLYSLTQDESLRGLVLQLVGLGWPQHQLVMHQLMLQDA